MRVEFATVSNSSVLTHRVSNRFGGMSYLLKGVDPLKKLGKLEVKLPLSVRESSVFVLGKPFLDGNLKRSALSAVNIAIAWTKICDCVE